MREPLCVTGAVLSYLGLLACLVVDVPLVVPWTLGAAAVALVAVRH